MLSRRAFVLGGGAILVAGLGAGAVLEADDDVRTRVLHKANLSRSPDAHVPASGAPVRSGTFPSRFMGRNVGWTVALPPSGGPIGCVYCLHGRNDDHRYAFDKIHLQDVAAAQNARLAIAGVDGGPHSYWHRRADGTDALSMLLEEFIPMVERDLGVPPQRALLGWSMGGYGALLAAETAPERFRAVAVGSAALWTSPGATAPGAFDDAADYRRNDVFARTDRLRGLTVRIDCGRNDPFITADQQFAARLSPPPQTSFGPGFHDAAYWRSVASAQIASLTTALRA